MNGSELLPTFLKGPGWNEGITIKDLRELFTLNAKMEKSIVLLLPKLSKRFSTGALRSSIQFARKVFNIEVVAILRVLIPTLSTELMNRNAVTTDMGIDKNNGAIEKLSVSCPKE